MKFILSYLSVINVFKSALNPRISVWMRVSFKETLHYLAEAQKRQLHG